MVAKLSRDEINTSLFLALLDAAKTHGPDKVILEDSERQSLSYKRLVLASLVLGAQLSRGTKPREAVGVLLPNITAMAVTLFGLNAFARPSCILNFTSGPRNVASAVTTAEIPRVVTSRRFVEAAQLDDVINAITTARDGPGRKIEIMYLEDVRTRIGAWQKFVGFWRSLRARAFARSQGAAPNAAAAILFTSGTEGVPKGVVLSNKNLVANAKQIFSHGSDALSDADVVLNPLPMFHSFGLTAATLMPILNGMKTVLYPSPLHYKQVVREIARTKATFLLATDTFLTGYARAAEPGQLDSVRIVVAGAERVRERTREAWRKYGTEILEGYGATECSPVIAVNLPNASRVGSVGRALPLIETRLEPVEGIESGGRLYVRGPNVMAGYILADRPGRVIPPGDGWHDTGDIVEISDGFITIRGRAKRFAKIGGEMVSLAAVEAMASGLWPNAQHVAVNLPDQRKGELLLATDEPSADKAELLAYARKQGFSELWVPKAVLVVSAIPVLGSGKVDFAATRTMVSKARTLL